jgi:uncharacterized short protein YbdD (DUF466 family)
MVGMPDYDNYVEHMQTKHPDQPVMDYEAFFRERQEAVTAARLDRSVVEQMNNRPVRPGE